MLKYAHTFGYERIYLMQAGEYLCVLTASRSLKGGGIITRSYSDVLHIKQGSKRSEVLLLLKLTLDKDFRHNDDDSVDMTGSMVISFVYIEPD
jgi:hypothetical protein